MLGVTVSEERKSSRDRFASLKVPRPNVGPAAAERVNCDLDDPLA